MKVRKMIPSKISGDLPRLMFVSCKALWAFIRLLGAARDVHGQLLSG